MKNDGFKSCGKCGVNKSIECFYRNSYGKDGLNSICKQCKSETGRRYREKNKSAEKARCAKWYRENKDRHKEWSAKWYQKNKKACLERGLKREKERLSSDPSFALIYRARRAARRGLTGGGSPGFFRHMPYSQDEFVQHLVSTLPQGYSKDDICDGAKLHIDHIRPVCSFNLTDKVDQEFLDCWALENLRLLPASENLRKSGHWDE